MTRSDIVNDFTAMIDDLEDLYGLASLQTIAADLDKEYTVRQLATRPLGNGHFEIDYVINMSSTANRFLIRISADGVGGDFYNTYNEITNIASLEYNGSIYDI